MIYPVSICLLSGPTEIRFYGRPFVLGRVSLHAASLAVTRLCVHFYAYNYILLNRGTISYDPV